MTDLSHTVYRFRNVYFMLGVDMASFNRQAGCWIEQCQQRYPSFNLTGYDTLVHKRIPDRLPKTSTVYFSKCLDNQLSESCLVRLYDINMVNRTYARLNCTAIHEICQHSFCRSAVQCAGRTLLGRVTSFCHRIKLQGLGFDVEGTNTAGDFGIAGNASYTHRNLFNGSEMLQAKFRGAYEAVSSQAITSVASNYVELGGEINLTLPEFKAPFLKASFKQKLDATTELRSAYQLMTQTGVSTAPVASLGMRYNWTHENLRQTFDLIDLSYTYMPWVSTSDFAAKYLNDHVLVPQIQLRGSFHFTLCVIRFSYSSVPFRFG